MAKRVTQLDIENMNNLYLKYGTYAEVARQTGFSTSTVRKYVIKDYQPQDRLVLNKYEGEIPEIDFDMFKNVTNWGDLCVLTNVEKDEIRELWKELSL